MKIKYSPEFKAMYDVLPADVQRKFRAIDARVGSGDLDSFDRQGWAYFIDLDDTHTAMGSYREDDDVFYWILIGGSTEMPVIL